MNYVEFLQKLQASKINVNDKHEEIYIQDILEQLFIKGSRKTPRVDFICEQWQIGGLSGGSCWDDSEPVAYETPNRQPATFEDLDAILACICPTITYLHYKKIEDLIQYGQTTEYEYYGNRTDYMHRHVELPALYTVLSELGHISAS